MSNYTKTTLTSHLESTNTILEDFASRLYILIPMGILTHYSDQQKIKPSVMCADMILKNSAWADRLFDADSQFSLEDIIHDFVELMTKDEHFVPRI
jgi:hypothetical protein